ncbi:hypothetical protein FG386_001133 [Cryptosporidium ryanae]|uniref:uncharacterized protein n=1 Tax=Cryptosporidium ryanae TaxID=515981 RepID=UPI00351A5E81|nr:hypothetical protein FG386_001133 [Cryptosporidium ryanae]
MFLLGIRFILISLFVVVNCIKDPSNEFSAINSDRFQSIGRINVGKIDLIEATSLYESEEVLNKLVLATRRQQELKEREINIKAAIGSNLHKLNAISELLQLLIESTSLEITGVVNELKNALKESEIAKSQFLIQQNYKVVPTQKLPLAEYSEEELDEFSKFSNGEYQGLDCPLSCSPSSCDNNPTGPTHCFKAETLKNGSFLSTCVPFTNSKTLKCPKGFIRCALSQPSRGNLYEILEAPDTNLEKREIVEQEKRRSIAVSGRNMHQCLRLLVVSKKTSCNIDNIFAAVDESRQLIVPNGNSIFPKIKGDIAIFEDVQVKKPGKYRLCLLQFYQDPKISGGEGARIMGSDTIGELSVLKANNDKADANTDNKTTKKKGNTNMNIDSENESEENGDQDGKDEMNSGIDLEHKKHGIEINETEKISDKGNNTNDVDKHNSGVFWYVLPIIIILISSGAGFAYYYYINNKEVIDSKFNLFSFFRKSILEESQPLQEGTKNN